MLSITTLCFLLKMFNFLGDQITFNPFQSGASLRLLFWCPGLPRKLPNDVWGSNVSPTKFWVKIHAQIWLENIAALCGGFCGGKTYRFLRTNQYFLEVWYLTSIEFRHVGHHLSPEQCSILIQFGSRKNPETFRLGILHLSCLHMAYTDFIIWRRWF